jgi:acyl-CoA synthetase (AMP-forming)/AMP-acid ligase II
MLTGYRRRPQAPPPLPPTIAALLRLRGEGAGRDELAFRVIDRTTDTIATATYEELYRRSAWVARELARHGVRRGDPVVLFLESCLEFPHGLFGAMLLGALPAAVAPPLDPRGHGAALEHLRRVVGQLGARVVLSSSRYGRLAEPVCRDFAAPPLILDRVGESDGEGLPGEGVARDEPVLVQYTSGTRGDPKPIALSTRALLTNLQAVGDAFTIMEGDVGLSWLPLHHDMGLQPVFFSLVFRMPLVLMAPSEFLRCPAAWLRAISRYGVTHSPAPPFGYLYAAQRIREEELAGVDLSRWRVAMCGADIIPAAGLEGFAARFAHLGFRPSALLAAYGLAEHTVAVSFGRPSGGLRVDTLAGPAREAMGGGRPATAGSPLRIVSVGRPIVGHGVRVVDAAGREVPDGTQGEIQVCGPSQMLEYRGMSPRPVGLGPADGCGPATWATSATGSCSSRGSRKT